MSADLFRRDRPFDQLDGFYTEWSEHLTKDYLPLLRDLPPSDATNAAVLQDLRSYYDTIDHYATKETIFHFLFPSWRSNSLETPILFLGDIHPRLLTDLIHSLIDQDTITDLAAWEDLSIKLENTINVAVTRLLGEMKGAQDGFVRRFSDKWVSSFLGSRSGTVVMETASSVMEEEAEDDGAVIRKELVRIFREANKLRKDTINDIVGVLNTNQLALFLESVCKFLAGFKHQDEAFQNSLFGRHLTIQQLPSDEQLFDPPGEVVAPHQHYPPPMIMQQHPQDGFNNYPPPHMIMQQHPPHGHQFFRPFAPSGLVIAHQNYRPPMMQHYAPQPPPPPMNQQHAPGQVHVIYVGNLDSEATPELLRQIFSRYRSLRDTKICVHQGSGHKYGFVSFADETEQRHAMQHMNRRFFLGREMHTGFAAKNTI